MAPPSRHRRVFRTRRRWLFAWTKLSRTVLFWVAFVLTRPLGAVPGDLLDKPATAGGMNFSRIGASAALLAVIILLLKFFPQRASRAAH